MACKRRCAQESSRASRCHSKPTCPVVKRIAKGSLPRKVRERRRSPSRTGGGKLIPASFFDELAKKAVENGPEYLRQRVGYPLPLKGMMV